MSFIYTFILIYLVVFSLLEMYSDIEVNKVMFYSIVVVMWLTVGLAYGVSPDWVAYWDAFERAYWVPFSDILNLSSITGMERGYIYLNKLISLLGFEFGGFTLIFTGIMLYLKTTTIYKYGGYVFLALILYTVPHFFFEDHIHFRQGMANAICIFSIRYIIDRKLWKFLLCIIIAFQFHKSSAVFFFAYWIVTLKLNSALILTVVSVAVIMNYTGLNVYLDLIMGFMPFGISESYESYSSHLLGDNKIDTALGDAVKILTVLSILLFDKQASANDQYYPVFRNLYLAGIVLYFFFGSGIFAARLPGYYAVYICLLVPRMVKGLIHMPIVRNIVFILFLSYTILLYARFSYLRGGDQSGFGNYKTFFTPEAAAYGLFR